MEKIKEKLEEIERISRPSGIDSPFIHKQAESVLSLIEEMKKTGTWVEIPEVNENGGCNHACPFWEGTDYGCFLNLAQHGITDWKPIFWCPRYREEGKMNITEMPIMLLNNKKWYRCIPFGILSQEWAKKNHQQTLQRLAERGGLSASEAVALIEKRDWKAMNERYALEIISVHIENFELKSKERN